MRRHRQFSNIMIVSFYCISVIPTILNYCIVELSHVISNRTRTVVLQDKTFYHNISFSYEHQR